MTQVPRVLIQSYLEDPSSAAAREACAVVAAALRDIGVVRLVHPRNDLALTQRLRDRSVDFYRLPVEEKRKMDRPDTGRNCGWSPPFTEKPGPREAARARIAPDQAPLPLLGPDPKERYMMPIGPAPMRTDFAAYNLKEPVYPEGFADWVRDAQTWGLQSLEIVFALIRMATIGLGVEDAELFTRLMEGGPHVFGPTGCDLSLHGKPGTVIAGFHTDMGFGTIHAPSNSPGLRVWTRDLQRIDVAMEPDELLFQAGRQFEICTGGVVLAGFHEVVATERMRPLIEREQAQGKVPWRVSVTMFNHVASDQMLEPKGVFDTPEARELYRDDIMLAGERMRRQLKKRGLEPTG